MAGLVASSAGVSLAEDVNGAARAFAQAQEVMLTGDVARAADLYELADELAPSAPALRNAARARLAASHNAMAATHAAELLRRYPGDKESRGMAEAILSKLSPVLTELDITCSESCKLTMDGKAASSGSRERHLFFTQPGARTVVAVFEGDRKATKQITARAGETSALKLEAPPKPVEAPAPPVAKGPSEPVSTLRPDREPVVEPKPAKGLSRVWVLGAAVATVGLGAGAALQGMATLDTRDQIKEKVAANDMAAANKLYDDGRSQQLRTNILLGATAAAGVATVVLGIFTNWSGSRSAREEKVVVVPHAGGGGSVVYGLRF